MTSVPIPYLTPDEYLAKERRAEYKSEFFQGEMFAMSGASREHNLIAGNLNRILGNQLLNRPCEVYPGDMRVKVSRTGLYTYPDVVVACGNPEFEDAELDTLLNPTVLFEVLSQTTEAYDRGRKSGHYRTLASLREYVLAAQDRCHIELYTRQPDDRWLLSESDDPEGVLRLRSIGCELRLAEVYAKVAFGEFPRDTGRGASDGQS